MTPHSSASLIASTVTFLNIVLAFLQSPYCLEYCSFTLISAINVFKYSTLSMCSFKQNHLVAYRVSSKARVKDFLYKNDLRCFEWLVESIQDSASFNHFWSLDDPSTLFWAACYTNAKACCRGPFCCPWIILICQCSTWLASLRWVTFWCLHWTGQSCWVQEVMFLWMSGGFWCGWNLLPICMQHGNIALPLLDQGVSCHPATMGPQPVALQQLWKSPHTNLLHCGGLIGAIP